MIITRRNPVPEQLDASAARLSRRQSDDEAAAALLQRAAGFAPVSACDLAHQREAEACSGAAIGTLGTIDRPKHRLMGNRSLQQNCPLAR